MEKQVTLLLFGLAAVAALPHQPIIRKLSSGLRYQYQQDGDGQPHSEDPCEIIIEVQPPSDGNYNPDTQNIYHLFTRKNPSVSQVLVPGNDALVSSSNFNASLRTAVLIHGWLDNATADFNAVMVPAFLYAEDINVIVVDWGAGAWRPYLESIGNAIASGESVARFINWLNNATGADPTKYHIVGFSLGAHKSGVIGRNLDKPVDYLTGLDPAFCFWSTNENRFRATDGSYTEVIHTNIALSGYVEPLADVDFYPNGGQLQPGCSNINTCNHFRSFFFLAESIRSGGFTGRRCNDYQAALIGNCTLSETLPMGGLTPKLGQTGVYYLETNASPPFARG